MDDDERKKAHLADQEARNLKVSAVQRFFRQRAGDQADRLMLTAADIAQFAAMKQIMKDTMEEAINESLKDGQSQARSRLSRGIRIAHSRAPRPDRRTSNAPSTRFHDDG